MNLTNSQVIILKTLARNPSGLTRESLAEKTGVVCDNGTLGPQLVETVPNHPDSLYALRLVRPAKFSPDSPVLWSLTPGGEKAASLYRARERGPKLKVDTKRLDKLVLAMKPLRTYGFESYTEDDLKEIRSQLSEDDQTVTLGDLKMQIIARRKQGAYSENTIIEPDWYVEYRTSHEGKVFAAKVNDHYQGCAICLKTDDVRVYHRRFEDDGSSVLCVERVKDGIVLCPQCHKRNGRFLPEIPECSPIQEQETIDESEELVDSE